MVLKCCLFFTPIELKFDATQTAKIQKTNKLRSLHKPLKTFQKPSTMPGEVLMLKNNAQKCAQTSEII